MIPRKTPLARSGRIKPRNAKRHNKEWTRAYGSSTRVAWVASLPCLVADPGYCVGAAGASENAHVGTGGMARKADAAAIVPLCARHHRDLHTHGAATFQRRHMIDLADAAARIDALWQQVAA